MGSNPVGVTYFSWAHSSTAEQVPFKHVVGGSNPSGLTFLLRGRLTVGQAPLERRIGVRIPAPQPMKKFILLLFLALFFFLPSRVFAKDYSIPSADFEVRINPDGSVNITETRTYSFDGSFSWADEWIILKKDYKISNFEVWEGEKKYTLDDSELPYTYEFTPSPDR